MVQELHSVTARVAALRAGRRRTRSQGEATLAAFHALWRDRLTADWRPPVEGSAFPWSMVRPGLLALVMPPLMPSSDLPPSDALPVVGLILAGNTPLLAWHALAACVRTATPVFVKGSRAETLWPRLFRDALTAVDPLAADALIVDHWDGATDVRTEELLSRVDALIVYGADATIEALSARFAQKPLASFGHAISVGIALPDADIAPFARDILTYDQAGCLSPQTIFVCGDPLASATTLADALAVSCDALGIPPRVDPAEARRVREARDLAAMEGATVVGDASLRWTIVAWSTSRSLPEPIGRGLVSLVPLADPGQCFDGFGASRGRISSVGVAGTLLPDAHRRLLDDGVTRVCAAGTMQAPPLDWENGGIDLTAWLWSLRT